MNRSLTLLGASALTLVVLTAGCQSRSPDTVLLKKDPGSSVIYRAPGENDVPYATNVVHVPRDARFSLSLEALNPGWLHEAGVRKTNNSLSSEAGLAGKDLWLLIHIRTLSSNDALQVESKRISRASLVKYDLRSFGLIPLTVDEVTPFALEANTDYEVDIRLYEVKKGFQRASFDNRPGLSGVARTAWATTTDTFKSLVGNSGTKPFTPAASDDLPIERQLLEAGGSLQFDARFAIYRSADTLAPRHPDDDPRGGTLINHYQLTDPYNRRITDRQEPRKDARFTDAASYLEHLQSLENAEIPGRQDAFLRFRIESMWSPVVETLAKIQAAPATPENVSQEQALAAESLAATARETFMKVSEEEKQASLAATESLRKSSETNSAQLEETSRALSRKTQQVAASRAAMEIAQARALAARQAVEAAASRAAQAANAEKTVELANTALDAARRSTEAAVKSLDDARAALQETRAAAEAARLKKEEWMQTETRSKRRLDEVREQLAALTVKAEKKPDDAELRQKLVTAEQQLADTTKSVETAASEWKLAQKDQEAKLNEVEDRIDAVAQKRLALAEAEQEKQRARTAKDQADVVLNGTNATDPRPAILRARSL
ncbi:hypothetical protein [Rariglobus hedericola]|uniref:Uncharacterized protein n=1 Tax=Rariglobus hedericola TaxID=2597822 RepID=A0A556QK44_9BACT|nr:hypothetical protein [Rariglobus hedericola]TSJ76982.1 hypothetical protein FPL22_12770 [Rariglobus hedericola]